MQAEEYDFKRRIAILLLQRCEAAEPEYLHCIKPLFVVRKYYNHQDYMKIILTTFLLSLSFSLFAQKNIIGRYRDYFGSRIELNSDSTFKYTWRFDLSYSWTKGTWSLKNDTVYFHMIQTYDTIIYNNNNGTSTNKVILSVDETPERMTNEQHTAMGLSSGGQNTHSHPEKLFFKKGRLYKIHNGRLIVKKQKGFWGTDKKWKPWFFKSD